MTKEPEEDMFEDTTKEERRILCSIVRKTGSKLSGLMFVSGILVVAFGIYLFAAVPDPVMSTRLGIIFTGAIGFVGGLNIMCGLLLLLGEETNAGFCAETTAEGSGLLPSKKKE
jgi:hypothetical protein